MTKFDPTQDLILPYLKGRSIRQVVIELNTEAQLNEQNALRFFQKKIPSKDQSHLFSELTISKTDLSADDYQQWRTKLMLEDNCIHLLEYLSYKGFHRFNYLIKQIHRIKAPWKLHRFYLSAMVSIIVSGIYFTQNQNAWILFLDFLKNTLPNLLIQACDLILHPQNLALLMLIYQVFNYLNLSFQILADNTTSKSHKINQLCHQSLYFILTSSAQLIIFFNLTISNLSGLLFILANLINLIWRLVECYRVNKENNFKNIPDDISTGTIELREQIRYIEQSNYYQKITQQLYLEGLSLFLTLISGMLSIVLGPNIACIATLCASFQFLLNLTKSYYYDVIEKNFAEKLQDKIQELYRPVTETERPLELGLA